MTISDIISITSTVVTVIATIITIHHANKAKTLKEELEFNIGKLAIIESQEILKNTLDYTTQLTSMVKPNVDNRGKKYEKIIDELQKSLDALVSKFGQQKFNSKLSENLNTIYEYLAKLRGLTPQDKEFSNHVHKIHKLIRECIEICSQIIIKRD